MMFNTIDQDTMFELQPGHCIDVDAGTFHNTFLDVFQVVKKSL